MTDLSDPAIREAGARALYANHFFTSKVNIRRANREWDKGLPKKTVDQWLATWDRIAAQLGPVIQQAEIREQMRGGIDDAGTEGT